MNRPRIEDNVAYLMKEFPTLTTYQALTLAMEDERNAVLEEAFGVTEDDNTPKFLEGIAMALRQVAAERS